jgi:hypothetical protein
MRTPLLLAATIVVSPCLADAQAYHATRGAPPPAIIRLDPVRVADALARADVAWQEGRGMEARRIYQGLIAEQRDAREFAGTAMWRLALNYLYADDKTKAAMQLDELADQAAVFGDPALQLRATFEAAVLWQQLKRPELVPARIERAMALLQSPAIPDADKEFVRERMK